MSDRGLTDAQAQAAALEALADPRIGPGAELDPAVRDALGETGVPDAARAAVERLVVERPIEWADHQLTQGELLAGFARHCADELDDVEVDELTPTVLVARWRTEVSRIELRAGTVGIEHLLSEMPTMLVTAPGEDTDRLVTRFLDAPELRARLMVFDPSRLEKIGAVRSSVFVYFEWHLRDAYGVKVVPSPAFTRGLVDRGVISLGMG
jgi:hypothetical protein